MDRHNMIQSVAIICRKSQYAFLKSIEQEAQVVAVRSGLKHQPRGRTSLQSYVLSVPFPAFICQVDKHTLDQLIVAADRAPITQRVHGAVLICVKTAAILFFVGNNGRLASMLHSSFFHEAKTFRFSVTLTSSSISNLAG